MPGYTSPLNIPFPLPSEPPNGAAQMEALANKADDLIDQEKKDRAAGDTAITTRLNQMAVSGQPTRSVESHLADIYTKVPTAVAAWGRYTAQTTAEGRLVVTHTLGVVPNVIICSPGVPGNVLKGVGLTVDQDQITSTSFPVFAWNLDTGSAFASQTLTVHWNVRK